MPAYNESRYVGGLVEEILSKYGDLICDLVVVDDGSDDDTAKIASKVGAYVIRHRRNMGKGMALKSGFNYALGRGYDSIMTMDGDGQHDPADIPRFISRFEMGDADIVLGVRMVDRGNMPLHRRFNNRLVSAVGSWLSGQRVSDFQCGYRLISSDVLRKVKLETTRYETESELLIKAGRLGFRIVTIPIRAIYNGAESNVDPLVEMRLFTLLLFRSLRER
jgi:glycosyltransferase involved in cell wall biosynthesis